MAITAEELTRLGSQIGENIAGPNRLRYGIESERKKEEMAGREMAMKEEQLGIAKEELGIKKQSIDPYALMGSLITEPYSISDPAQRSMKIKENNEKVEKIAQVLERVNRFKRQSSDPGTGEFVDTKPEPVKLYPQQLIQRLKKKDKLKNPEGSGFFGWDKEKKAKYILDTKKDLYGEAEEDPAWASLPTYIKEDQIESFGTEAERLMEEMGSDFDINLVYPKGITSIGSVGAYDLKGKRGQKMLKPEKEIKKSQKPKEPAEEAVGQVKGKKPIVLKGNETKQDLSVGSIYKAPDGSIGKWNGKVFETVK